LPKKAREHPESEAEAEAEAVKLFGIGLKVCTPGYAKPHAAK
jgi:hypothetical protein